MGAREFCKIRKAIGDEWTDSPIRTRTSLEDWVAFSNS